LLFCTRHSHCAYKCVPTNIIDWGQWALDHRERLQTSPCAESLHLQLLRYSHICQTAGSHGGEYGHGYTEYNRRTTPGTGDVWLDLWPPRVRGSQAEHCCNCALHTQLGPGREIGLLTAWNNAVPQGWTKLPHPRHVLFVTQGRPLQPHAGLAACHYKFLHWVRLYSWNKGQLPSTVSLNPHHTNHRKQQRHAASISPENLQLSRSAAQQVPRTVCGPKVHHRVG